MTAEQRAKVEAIKEQRAKLATPIERIAFDNDPRTGPLGLRLIAMIESA